MISGLISLVLYAGTQLSNGICKVVKLSLLISRVLRPPGGGSNFSLGFDEPKEQPVRRNKMASSIFGTPEENPPSWAKSSGKNVVLCFQIC